MNKIYKKAKAKINLTLNILDTRDDGYHELESIFQCIYLYDEITIEKVETSQDIEIICNVPTLQKDNIITKAYHKLKLMYPQIGGVKVILNKKIPMEAGMGGGSADCAAFIVSMNKLFSLDMTMEQMEALGATIGADVVPCMREGTIHAKGIGEKARYIEDNTNYYIVAIKPEVSFSTKMMFQTYDAMDIKGENSTHITMMQGLKENNIELIGNSLYNVFEEVVRDNEEIKNGLQKLKELGANGALMAGSGSAIFGIFKEKEVAKKAYYQLKETYRTYFCKPYNKRNRK